MLNSGSKRPLLAIQVRVLARERDAPRPSNPDCAPCFNMLSRRTQLRQDSCGMVLANRTGSSFYSSDPTSVNQPLFANKSCNPIYLHGTSIGGDSDTGGKRDASLDSARPM